MLTRLTVTGATLGVICVAFVAAASGASHKVYVERDIVSQQLAYRPHAIVLAADGTFAMTGIRWQSYGGPVAKATARAFVRSCTPNCAQGQVSRPPATLRLAKKVMCRGVPIYSQLHWQLHAAPTAGERNSGSNSLRPVGEHGC